MSGLTNSCQGHYDYLSDCSASLDAGYLTRKFWKLKYHWVHLLWHIENKGIWPTFKLSLSKITMPFAGGRDCSKTLLGKKKCSRDGEVLNLKAGELVEVKSEEEIIGTLDENKKNKGLLWMVGMRKFCGKRYRVYKKLERILLESTGEYRKLKNTVLLEDVVCDGLEFGGVTGRASIIGEKPGCDVSKKINLSQSTIVKNLVG